MCEWKIREKLRTVFFPLCLIVFCPQLVLIFWHTNVALNGSLSALFSEFTYHGFFTTLYKIESPIFWGSKISWSILGVFLLLQAILMRFIPGKEFKGPATPHGYVPVYRANGVACFFITIILFFFTTAVFNLFSMTIIYDYFGEILCTLNLFGFFLCILLYIKGRFFPSGPDKSLTGNFVFDFYWGTELYPQIWGWNIKVFLISRIGVMSWAIIIISFAAKQSQLYDLSNSMLIAVFLMLIYLTKFFFWETGYWHSLDIMHDYAGFYTCWGSLVWVPGFYTSPILYLVHHPNQLPFPLALFILAGGLISIFINYDADRQRQRIRATQGHCTLWGKKPILIHAQYETAKGQIEHSVLLISGWWGLSRHFHYLPEISAALFWTLPALFLHVLPYLYVIYLTILLVHRAYRDDIRCHKKYGKYWEEYCNRVPNRIWPW